MDLAGGDAISGAVLSVLHSRWLRGEHLVVTPVMLNYGMFNLYSVRSVERAIGDLLASRILEEFVKTPARLRELLWRDIAPPPDEPMYCGWCKRVSMLLHKHHYPIPRERNGYLLVEICAGCHTEFHHIERCAAYEPTQETIRVIENLSLNREVA